MHGPLYKKFEKLVDFAFSLEFIFVIIALSLSVFFFCKTDRSLPLQKTSGSTSPLLEKKTGADELPKPKIPPAYTGSSEVIVDRSKKSTNDYLEQSVYRELMAEGFTANQVEVVKNTLDKYLQNPNEISLNMTVTESSERLKLNSNQTELLEKTIFSAVYTASGKVKLDEWEACLNAKLDARKPNECELEKIDVFRNWVIENSEGNAIPHELSKKAFFISHKLTKEMIEKCGSVFENLVSFWDTNIGICK